jgi:hypothetical protein
VVQTSKNYIIKHEQGPDIDKTVLRQFFLLKTMIPMELYNGKLWGGVEAKFLGWLSTWSNTI